MTDRDMIPEVAAQLGAVGLAFWADVLFTYVDLDPDDLVHRKIANGLFFIEIMATRMNQAQPGAGERHLAFVNLHRAAYSAEMERQAVDAYAYKAQPVGEC